MAGGRGSWILSVRKSMLEVADAVVGISTISLTAIPKYHDTQAKIVYDLSPTQKLSLNWLYGYSTIDLVGDLKETDNLRKNVTDSSSIESILPVVRQYVAGMNLRSLWGKKGYSNFTVYSSGVKYDTDVSLEFTRQQRNAMGKVVDYTVLTSYPFYQNKSQESYLAARYELYYQPHARHRMNIGGQMQSALEWVNNEYIASDTSRYDLNGDGRFEAGPIVRAAAQFNNRIGFGKANKYYLYASDTWAVASRLDLTVGARYDHFTYSGKGAWSPRLSLAWKLQPALTTMTLAAGRYPQTQPFPWYGDRYNSNLNRRLDHMNADHAVVGLEHVLGEGLKLNTELYYKRYDRTVVSEEFVHQADRTFRSERNLAIGERRACGLEFFLQQKQVHDYYGTISLSFSKSLEKDLRQPALTDWYNSEFDYPVIATVIAGKVVRGTKSWLDKSPFFIKYPAMVLPLADEMEVGFKYRYQTGRPYTPQEFVTWEQHREGQIAWSRGGWISTPDINSSRYPDYHRFDFQWLSRYYHKSWNLNIYIAIQNLFNTKNVFYTLYRSDGKKENVYQYAFFPVGGVEIEF